MKPSTSSASAFFERLTTPVIFVPVLVAFLTLGSYFWLRMESPPCVTTGRSFVYVNELTDLYRTLQQADPAEWLARFWQRSFPLYEPVYLLAAISAAKLGGPSLIKIILMSNGLFLAILFFALFALARALLLPRSAWVACALLALFPGFYGISRLFYVQIPQTAAIVVTFWLLWRGDGFRSLRSSLLVGAAVGIGLLTKFEFLAFVIGPIGIFLLKGMTDNKGSVERGVPVKCFLNFLAAVGLATVMAAIHFRSLATGPWTRMGQEVAKDPYFNLKLYTFGFFESSLGLFFSLLFLAALFLFVKGGRLSVWHKLAIASGFLVPWVSLVLMKKAGWGIYLLPALPMVAIIISVGLSRLTTLVRRAVLSLTILVGVIQYLDFSFPGGPGLDRIEIANFWGRPLHYFQSTADVCHRPLSHSEELNVIKRGLGLAAEKLATKPNRKVHIWLEFFPMAFKHQLSAPHLLALDTFYEKFPIDFNVYVFQPFDFEEALAEMENILIFGPPEFTEMQTARWFRTYYETAGFFPVDNFAHAPQPLLSTGAQYREKLERLETLYMRMIREFEGYKLIDWNGESMILFERRKKDGRPVFQAAKKTVRIPSR